MTHLKHFPILIVLMLFQVILNTSAIIYFKINKMKLIQLPYNIFQIILMIYKDMVVTCDVLRGDPLCCSANSG